MNFESIQKFNGCFHPVENPDELMQYKNALSIILQEDPVSQASDSKYHDEWIFASVWRMAILDTSDDRLPSGQSLIQMDLKMWDDWLIERTLSSRVRMVSMPLLESTVENPKQVFTSSNKDKGGWMLNSVKISLRKFNEFQSIVDSVSADMSASHLLWVYKNGVPVYNAIHHDESGDEGSLTTQIESIMG